MWLAYIEKRGSFNTGRRIEAGAALIAAVTQGVNGIKTKQIDFMPHEQPEARAEPMTDDDVLKAFGYGN